MASLQNTLHLNYLAKVPLKGRTSKNKKKDILKICRDSCTEVQNLKCRGENPRLHSALEGSIRPFVSTRLSKQEIRGTEQHRVWSFS